ncbi:MAG: DUF45 domain-containing protein [Candidatus Pacebacteria bacterium]|nr:DUF45 domain-containing protein [Candidatus Paceibacterota bacterium]
MIDYHHRRSNRARKFTLKVESGGRVVLTTPWYTPKLIADQFVKQNLDWIKQQKKKTNQKLAKIDNSYQISIFGKTYLKTFFIEYNPKLRSVSINQDQLRFNLPGLDRLACPKIKRVIEQELELFLKKAARVYLKKRVEQLADKMGQEFNRLYLRNQKTRWGSCSSKGNLSLNWRLVHFPTQIIDYVLVHELAHLEHHNHSTRFWQLVGQFDPDYRQHRRWLKNNGISLT